LVVTTAVGAVGTPVRGVLVNLVVSDVLSTEPNPTLALVRNCLLTASVANTGLATLVISYYYLAHSWLKIVFVLPSYFTPLLYNLI